MRIEVHFFFQSELFKGSSITFQEGIYFSLKHFVYFSKISFSYACESIPGLFILLHRSFFIIFIPTPNSPYCHDLMSLEIKDHWSSTFNLLF